MLFKPYSDECTTFENVRVLKFHEHSFEVNVMREGESIPFKNAKPVKIFYNTDNTKIINTLQEVRLASDKLKMKCRLDELIDCSDIQKALKKWLASAMEPVK